MLLYRLKSRLSVGRPIKRRRHEPPELLDGIKVDHAFDVFHPSLSSMAGRRRKDRSLREGGHGRLGKISAFGGRRVEPKGPCRVKGMLNGRSVNRDRDKQARGQRTLTLKLLGSLKTVRICSACCCMSTSWTSPCSADWSASGAGGIGASWSARAAESAALEAWRAAAGRVELVDIGSGERGRGNGRPGKESRRKEIRNDEEGGIDVRWVELRNIASWSLLELSSPFFLTPPAHVSLPLISA